MIGKHPAVVVRTNRTHGPFDDDGVAPCAPHLGRYDVASDEGDEGCAGRDGALAFERARVGGGPVFARRKLDPIFRRAGLTRWDQATGVDVDSHDNVYVFTRNKAMPIMVFDREGRFLRAWGEGMFQTTHFLRVTRAGRVWVTDRRGMQAFEFDSGGKLLLTVGRKGVLGDNNSTDAFNGMADLAVAKNGDFFIADGEGPNTRVVKFHKDGQFVKWLGREGQRTRPVQCAAYHRDRRQRAAVRGRPVE